MLQKYVYIYILLRVLCKNFLKDVLLEMKLVGHRIYFFSISLDFVKLLHRSQQVEPSYCLTIHIGQNYFPYIFIITYKAQMLILPVWNMKTVISLLFKSNPLVIMRLSIFSKVC